MPAKAIRKAGRQKTFDTGEQYRTEIEERTANGETLKQIAASLQARGINVTEKTISRRRLEWGLRQRDPRLAGTKLAKPRPRKTPLPNLKKAEIEERTRNGETAEQIAEALLAQGCTLNKGASSILRLQTFWGLIPPDPDRNRGRKRKSRASEPRAPKPPKSPKVSKRELEREANREQQSSTQHYPNNCNFGPKKGINGDNAEDGNEVDSDMHDSPVQFHGDAVSTSPTFQQGPTVATYDVTAEVMSVEILIDLATSTLSAAHGLKNMLFAYQSQTNPQIPQTGAKLTLDDLAAARKKVREAAGLMLDLAEDPLG